MAPDKKPVEQETMRTTIVGGRPPGSGKPLGPIPRGLEVLLKKAAVDSEFRKVLLEKRAEAAQEIGLVLDPAEAMMLAAIPAAQLEFVIAETTVAPALRPAFLGRAAAVMLVALGASVVAGCRDWSDQSKGHKSDRPDAVNVFDPKDVPPAPVSPPTPPKSVSLGVQPDRPPAKPDSPAEATPTAPVVTPTPTAPDVPKTRGIQPDRPPTPTAPAEGNPNAAAVEKAAREAEQIAALRKDWEKRFPSLDMYFDARLRRAAIDPDYRARAEEDLKFYGSQSRGINIDRPPPKTE